MLNDTQPLVSVVTPTYNRADFIAKAIDSVLAQSYGHFEMIIVDDGSQDNTRELIEAYDDPRISYHYQENQGQSIARNRGISLSQGEFICFLDSDNLWFPDKLEKGLAGFQRYPEADIVYGDCVSIDEQGSEISRENMRRYSGRIAALMLKDNFISMNTTMTRRRCFDEMGGFSNKDRYAEDYGLWLKFSTRYRFQYVPEYMAYYRIMDDQLSSDKIHRFMANEKIVLEFLHQYPDAVTRSEAREGLSGFYLRKARYFASVKNRSESYPAIARAIYNQPLSLSVWRGLAKVLIS